MKSSPSIWRYVVSVKSTMKILSIFVAFLENMNFKYNTSAGLAPGFCRKIKGRGVVRGEEGLKGL